MESMLLIWKLTVVKISSNAGVAMNCISGLSQAYLAMSIACCNTFSLPAFFVLVSVLQILGNSSSVLTLAIRSNCATPWSPIKSDIGFSSDCILLRSASSLDARLSATNCPKCVVMAFCCSLGNTWFNTGKSLSNILRRCSRST